MRSMLAILTFAVLSAGCGAQKDAPKPGPVAVTPKTGPPTVDPKDKGNDKDDTEPTKPPVTPDTKPEEKPKTDPPKKQPPVDVPQPKPPVVRPGDEGVRKALHNIGLAHQLFTDEKNRTPASAEDLEKFLDAGSKAKEMLKDGVIVVLWKSTKPDDPAKAVLAYEAAADKTGRRLVLTADYTLDVMPEAEFQKLPKVPQKK